MENLLKISPGLMIWTLFNFLIFLFLIAKFAIKPIVNGLKSREDGINASILAAENANAKAQEILNESRKKLDNAQSEAGAIIAKGREQAEALIRKTAEEADRISKHKVEEAKKEIELSKEAALKQLRTEVAGLVIDATEKILELKLDKDRDYKLVESSIEKLPKN